MLISDDVLGLASALIDRLRDEGLTIATAESCTGGLIAAAITAIAGSSDVMDSGFITYSNAAKTRMIGVPPELIERYGAVSEEVARAMASGAIANSAASLAVAVTGVAGPGGGSALKPVGLVHVAVARRDGAVVHIELRLGNIGRHAVRVETVRAALTLAYDLAEAALP